MRLRIQDRPRKSLREFEGNASESFYVGPLAEGLAFETSNIQGFTNNAWADLSAGTGYVHDEGDQYILFNAGPERVRMFLSTTAFSDPELDHYLGEHFNITTAALEVVQTLMYDGIKRHRWSSPDGVSYDDSMANMQLQRIYDMLKREQMQESAGAGGFGNAAQSENTPAGYQDDFDFYRSGNYDEI